MSEKPSSLAERINALLPQTQCGKCGHPGCRPYAEGIAAGEPINRCPPGGVSTIVALAALLDRETVPLDTTHGEHMPPMRAFIREAECIGCTKCIQVCPTDAILGGPKLMHTVIESECTGCDLCVLPCPVDCIDMLPAGDSETASMRAPYWQDRHEFRQQRLQENAQLRAVRKAERQELNTRTTTSDEAPHPGTGVGRKTPEQLREEIQAAVARAQARRTALAQDSKPEKEKPGP